MRPTPPRRHSPVCGTPNNARARGTRVGDADLPSFLRSPLEPPPDSRFESGHKVRGSSQADTPLVFVLRFLLSDGRSGACPANRKATTKKPQWHAGCKRISGAGCRISGMGASGDSKERLFYLNCNLKDASALIIPANSISRAPAAALLKPMISCF
jgi:hypothetical protein